jgi:hypothetical protein
MRSSGVRWQRRAHASDPNTEEHANAEMNELDWKHPMWGGPASIRPADAGKKIKGKKRHVLVDTQGLLMHAIVHSADVRDRDGRALLMASLFGAFPFLVWLYADGGYQGRNSRAR